MIRFATDLPENKQISLINNLYHVIQTISLKAVKTWSLSSVFKNNYTFVSSFFFIIVSSVSISSWMKE